VKQLKALFIILTAFAASHVMADEAQDAKNTKIAQRIKPVATVCASAECAGGATASAEPVAAAARSGEEVYNAACTACHSIGVAGAPKKGDSAAWKARLAQGESTVLNHAIHGLNAMPPKGTCANCSDDELLAAIHFMAGK
jgi:cytochrome c5